MNVEGVEPMTSVTPMVMKKRADVVNDGDNADAVSAQRAPKPMDNVLPRARRWSK